MTVIDWKGNSDAPVGTSRRQCLQVMTNYFREHAQIIGEQKTKVHGGKERAYYE
jgi:hypothetical protein